jgi:hypothetical protein
MFDRELSLAIPRWKHAPLSGAAGSDEETMPPYDLRYFGPNLRAGTVALGLAALVVDVAPAAPPGGSPTEPGAGLGVLIPDTEAPAQVAGPPSHTIAPGPGRISERGIGGILGGHESFAMEGPDISAAFDSLSRPQQARVLQRCKDIVARPAQADASQLAICGTLMAMSKR